MNDEEIKGKETPDPREETPPEVNLKQAREAKGLSIRELSNLTRLSPSILTAIENEDFAGLPEPVYTKTFIVTHAKALGGDARGILSRYGDYLEGLRRQREAEAAATEKPKRSVYTRLIILVIVLLALVLASFYFYQRFSGPSISVQEDAVIEERGDVVTEEPSAEAIVEKPADVTEEAPVSVIEEADRDVTEETPLAPPEEPEADLTVEAVPEGTGEPVAEATVVDEEPAAAGPGSEVIESVEPSGQQMPPPEVSTSELRPYTLEIEATEWTWLEITVDKNSPFEVMLKPGERLVRNASKKVMMIVGNASGVNITFNDEPLGSLGRHGEVILLTLPKGDE